MIEPSPEYLDFKRYFFDSLWVAIHIRRGDYLKSSDYHGLLDQKYYVGAVEKLRELQIFEKIAVFSDDVILARDTFPDADLYIGPKDVPSPAESLLLMSQCAAIVGANSSFSLWAALLNDFSPNHLIFPRPWYKEPSQCLSDPVPIEFQRLDVIY